MSNYPPWTQSESTSEVSPAKSYPVVLEKLPVEQEEKISRYFESFVGQSEQDEVLNEPTRADSDSADSLFITQKPVPAPVRAARSLCSKSSDPKPLRSRIESEDDTSSSPSEEEPKSDHKRRKKKYKLPECSFPFIKERNCKFRIMNVTLHNSAMGGFFKCVRQIWQGQQAGEDVASVLPTVDTDGSSLSPLSEEEGEGEGNEDIKVVEKKLFARPLKTKSHQTCCTQLKEIKRRKAANAGKETSQEIQQEMQTEATRSRIRLELEDSDSSDDGETACRAEAEKKEINEVERVRTNGHQSIEEEELYNKRSEEEESTVAEPRADQPSPKARTQSQQDVVSNPHTESVGSETREKNKRRKRKVKEVEESDGAASVNVEVNEIPGHSSDIRAEPSMSQASDELEMTGNDLMEKLSNDENVFRQVETDTPDLKQRKKKKNKVKEQEKPDVAASENVEVDDIPSQSLDNGAAPLTSQTRDGLQMSGDDLMERLSNDENKEGRVTLDFKQKNKKSNSPAEDVNQEVDGNLERDVREEDPALLSRCNMETGRKKKKKKRKRKEDEENLDEEQMESSANFETDAKKKRESVAENLNQEVDENLERDLGEEDATLLSSCHVERVGKKKTKKKRGKEDEENVDMEQIESIADLEPNAKKEKKDPEEQEKVDNMHQTEEDLDSQNADLVTKKKKKKKKKDRDNSEVKEAQIDDSVSVSVSEKEERRTSSFLDADADSLLSVEACSQDAERVPAGDFEAESVEIANNFEKYRKKQKKNKRKMEKDHRDLGEASATCLSGLPEGADTKVKRKRKQTGSESEMVTPEERSQIVEEAGRISEDLVPRKKEKKETEEPRDVLQQTLPALNTCNSTSHMDQNTSAPLETCESTDMRGKKKKVKNDDGIQLKGVSATNSTDFGPQVNKDEKRNKQSGGLPSSPVFLKTSLSMSEVSSSDTIMKKKRLKVKKELLNPNEELLTDF